MSETALLTGATGFLGSHLAHALLDAGYTVVILKRSTSNIWRIADIFDQLISYDIDKVLIEEAFQKQPIDIVIHTACSYGRKQESLSQILRTNVLFSLEVLENGIKYGVSTFVNTNTLLPPNITIYSLSKRQFADWLKLTSPQIQVIDLRLEHMYGPKDDVTKFVPWLLSQLQSNAPEIQLTSGIQKRDFIYIDDIVAAYMMILKAKERLGAFSEFDVGTGANVAVRDFVETLYNEYKRKHPHCKTKLNYGAIPLRDGEVMTISVDTSSLRHLGWSSTISVSEGIKKLLATT